jgi:hypothetical protein
MHGSSQKGDAGANTNVLDSGLFDTGPSIDLDALCPEGVLSNLIPAESSRSSGTVFSAWRLFAAYRSGRVSVQTEAANVGIERLGLLHIAEVSSLWDDRELSGRNRAMQLLRNVHGAAAVVFAP